MIERFESRPILSIVIVVFLMLAMHLDVLEVSIMEARSFVTAREMVNDGNWILTTLNGEPRYQKPPLPTWIMAGSGLLFGMKSVASLRFPAVLMVMLIGAMIYLISRRVITDKRHSLINALIAITSFYIIGITYEAPVDIYTHAFMLTGIYFLHRVFDTESVYTNGIYAGFFMGLSFMCKGPIGLFGLFLPFAIAYGLTFKFQYFRSRIASILLMTLVFIVVGTWWFAYVRIMDPISFMEITTRETGNWASYHVRPFYYYWSFFIQSGIWTIPALISLLYPYLKNKVLNQKAYKLTLIWTLAAVVLLSLIPEKKPRYLVPVLIPLAMNIGFYLEYLVRCFHTMTLKERLPAYVNFVMISLIALVLPFVAYFFIDDKFLKLGFSYWSISLVSLFLGLFILASLRVKNILVVFYLCITFMVSLLLFGMPLVKNLKTNESYKTFEHKSTHQYSADIYMFGEISPELVWAFGSKIDRVENSDYLTNSSGDLSILVGLDYEATFRESFQDYNISLLETFDLNLSGNKSRLIANLYSIKR